MPDTRTLILMRHGKSAYPLGVDDRDRPLAPRGQREASLAGDWLRATQPAVDAVLCSTSTRTRETLVATGIDTTASFHDEIYGASPHEVIDLIHMVDDSVHTLLVIGHAPGIPWTAWELADNRDSEQAGAMSIKFPTSGLAVLSAPGLWADLEPGTATLTAFHVPR